MNENNGNVNYSWGVIIFFTILIWPLGLIMILKRVAIDRHTAMAGSKMVKTMGIGLLTFGVLCLIAFANDPDAGPVLVAIFFMIAGICLIKTAVKIKKNAEDIRRYLAIVVNGGKRDLAGIASAMKKTYGDVRTDLQMMIDRGYLKGAYIDDGAEVLVIVERQQATVEQTATPSYTGMPVQVQKRVVQCRCCGANNVVVGAVGECEYCGSPIGNR